MKYIFLTCLLFCCLTFSQQLKAQDTIRLAFLEKPAFTFEVINQSVLYLKENDIIKARFDIKLIDEYELSLTISGEDVISAPVFKFQVSTNDWGYEFITFTDVDKLSEKERVRLLGMVEPVIISIDIGNDFEVIPVAYLSGVFK